MQSKLVTNNTDSNDHFQMAMYGELKHWPNWIETLVHINHFALVVNSSINILIYACKDEKFLNVLLESARTSRIMQLFWSFVFGSLSICICIGYLHKLRMFGNNQVWKFGDEWAPFFTHLPLYLDKILIFLFYSTILVIFQI